MSRSAAPVITMPPGPSQVTRLQAGCHAIEIGEPGRDSRDDAIGGAPDDDGIVEVGEEQFDGDGVRSTNQDPTMMSEDTVSDSDCLGGCFAGGIDDFGHAGAGLP